MKKMTAILLLVIIAVAPLPLLACGKNTIRALTMERTPCMGKCPWYKIEIREDGTVKYWGKKDAPRIGCYEGKIDKQVAKSLLNKFSKKKMQKAQDQYNDNVADVPMLHYTFAIGKDMDVKKVRQANFGPPYLVQYAQEFDELLAEVEWAEASDDTVE